MQRSAFTKVWNEYKIFSAKAIVEQELMARIASSAGQSVTSMIHYAEERERMKHKLLLKSKRAESVSERIEKGVMYKRDRPPLVDEDCGSEE